MSKVSIKSKLSAARVSAAAQTNRNK